MKVMSVCVKQCACLPHSFCWCQFILLGNRGTWVWKTCPELLPVSDPTRPV